MTTVKVILALLMLAAGGTYLVLRLIGTGRHHGQHIAPRGWTDDDVPTAFIPRVRTGHAPPWDPAPVTGPAALLAAPVDSPPPDVIIASKVVAPPLPGTLIPPVAELLGYASVDAAVDAFAAEWHSVESIFNGRHVREVRALTDGAS